MAIIKQGAKGSNVKKLQKSLNKHGAKPKLVEDGVFGPITDTAVRNFQKDSGLKVDGLVGKNTSHSLGFKPTSRSKAGVLFPVWDFGDHSKAVWDQLDTVILYEEKHKKIMKFMEKFIQSRVKKVQSSKDADGEAKKAAEIFTTRYFELKRAYEDVDINYKELLKFLASINNIQKIHAKAVRDGKVLLAERAILTAEKEVPKTGMHMKRTGKSLDRYDDFYKRMNIAHQNFLNMGGKF